MAYFDNKFFEPEMKVKASGKTHDYWKNHSFDYMDLYWQSDVSDFYILSKFVTAFLPRGKCLLISWLQSPSAVIFEPKKIKSFTSSTFPMSICHELMGPDIIILNLLNVEV